MLLLSLSLLGGARSGAQDLPRGFDFSEVAPGVFVHIGRQLPLDAPGHDDIANIGFIVGTNCVAVVDTGGSLNTGRALRAAIKRTTKVPICYVVNTHAHVDHVLGNAAFRDDQPSFVGHAALGAALVRSRKLFLTEYTDDLDAPPTPDQIIGPDRAVESDLDIELGDRRLSLHAWPKAHTDCDLTVYDRKTGTLWTGDLLFRERLPALDGSVKGWLDVIGQLAHMRVRLAVPGHGPVARDLASALIPERDYLQTLVDGVRGEIAHGESMAHAMESVGDAAKSNWLLWDTVHKRNVARVYQELEWE